jgi:hypothetical protein
VAAPDERAVRRAQAPEPAREAVSEGVPEAEPETAPVPAAPEPVLVAVNAHPWATIWIDGQEMGETPLAGIPVLPGPHVVAALMPDGRRIEREVVINDDNRHLRFH